MEVLDKECDLPEVPSFVEDATVTKYFEECVGLTPPPDTTLKELMDNSTQFPRYFYQPWQERGEHRVKDS